MPTTIWLRCETKPAEHRTILTPQHAAELIHAGFDVAVECPNSSVFSDQDYANAGCRLVQKNSWQSEAPRDAIILGLKELSTATAPLVHNHIHFAHAFKNQSGWREFLGRFVHGGGKLYDLEYLVDDADRRVAAFGRWAGFAGAGLAVLAAATSKQQHQVVLGEQQPRSSQQQLIDQANAQLAHLTNPLSAIVIGASGRCGQGAIEFLNAVGCKVTAWDIAETQRGGPFPEILEHDVFLNCVFVEKAIPPFINLPLLEQSSDRNLRVICDVSCDPYGDYNPVPLYQQCTTFFEPVTRIIESEKPLDLIAIDHLPSLLPRESSEDFCQQMMPYLLQLNDLNQGVWRRAGEVFNKKIELIQTKV